MEFSSMNGLVFNGVYLPEECIVKILSYLDDCTLLTSCNVVCKVWYGITARQELWYQKLKNLEISYKLPVDVNDNLYRNIYLNNVYGRNLVKNNDGTDGKKYWSSEIRSKGWNIENPPLGCQAIPEHLNTSSCFVTSHYLCSTQQVIHLEDFVPPFILNKFKFIVESSEWYTHRYDSGSKYFLEIELLDHDGKSLYEKNFEDSMILKNYGKSPEWKQAKITFEEDTEDVATIILSHGGNDHNFWAGHYGSKMTGSVVRLKFI